MKKVHELKVLRYNSEADFMESLFVINGKYECEGIEDEERSVKVWGETCIPLGRYKVELRKEGKFHELYKKKFPDWHVGMLHITDVPGFEFILIHPGNTDDDTAGCYCPGRKSAPGVVSESTKAYEKLYRQIAPWLVEGDEVYIEYLKIAA